MWPKIEIQNIDKHKLNCEYREIICKHCNDTIIFKDCKNMKIHALIFLSHVSHW